MRIGIDARLISETGVGRYIRNLVVHLAETDKKNHYVVFVRDANWQPPNARWTRRIVDIPWHSITEQFIMPWILSRERLDLVHIPYFNVPIFYPGRFVVTIHDLTILHFDTGKASTLPWIVYKIRRLGYFLALTVGLRRACKIIAVSKTTKQEIIDHFHIEPEKIVVTYEGVDKQFQISNFKFQIKNRIIKDPYFLYVGNAYPHKNLETLLKAFQGNDAKLVLVGKEDYFYRRIKASLLNDRVVFFGEADDRELASLYQNAIALVFPSLMEGFGLPALEALSLGCPVIASDIPVFHEVLGEQAIFFDPSDPTDLARKLDSSKKHSRTEVNLSKYSWPALASATLAAYESCHRV